MIVRTVLLATFLISSSFAQLPNLPQSVEGLQGFGSSDISSAGLMYPAEDLRPEAGGSIFRVQGQNAVDSSNVFRSHLANRTEVRRKGFVTPPARVTEGLWQGQNHVTGNVSTRHAVLTALYRATNGDTWQKNTNWDLLASPTMEELGTWHGVTVHQEKLTELQLNDNNLEGMLPPEIGDLTDLEVLWIDGNILDGGIPTEIGKLSQLRTLLLSHNELTGSIPAELGSLEELEVLWLHDNRLSGMIPDVLGNMTKLSSLVLSGNQLSGSIPDEVGNSSQLEILWLNDNTLSGEVPPALGDLQELQQLVLDNNDLSGSLPRSLLGLRKLEYLSFAGQSLCSPPDAAFQSWLRSIAVVNGPVCKEKLSLSANIDDLSFDVNRAITPLLFPEAMGGIAP